MTSRPRVRIAPSPTGFFHVGNARTALYNFLFARQQNGTFILRVEDTDAERHVHEATDALQRALRWLGLDWDEGPYFQSERGPLYRDAIEQLVAGGYVYYCDCTREVVQERTKDNPTPGYDRFCRDRGLEAGPGRALRFKVPLDDGAVTVHDVVRGDPQFPHMAIEDFVVARGDGSPLFILANVVDDLDMKMSHVIRGDDHLSNTPKYLLLWEALGGGEPPVFAHLPMLVNEKRQKLSKRRDMVFVEDFRNRGYLAEAMVNYLALVGWSPGNDREILTLDEMIAEFRLEDVVPSPGFFDMKKLDSINAEYIRALPPTVFCERASEWLPPEWSREVFARIAPEVQTRVTVLSDVPGMVDFLFFDEPEFDEKAWDKDVVRGRMATELFDMALDTLSACPWESEEIHRIVMENGEKAGLTSRKHAQAPIRVAVTGRSVGPPLFPAMEILGREKTLARLRAARERLAHG
jgi:glutamyl-tRNA synthetase